jgi:hypothetical protein
MDKEKIVMTESTEKLVKEAIKVDLENMTEQEFIAAVNSVKGLTATLTESGEIKIRQILLG